MYEYYKLGPDYFVSYFYNVNHSHDNRGNNSLLKIPKVKTESG